MLDCYKKTFARSFVAASSQELTHAAAALSAYPISMACWFSSDSITANQALMSIGRSGAANSHITLRAAGAVASDPVQIVVQTGGGASNAVSATGFKANTWTHAGGRTSQSSRFAYYNGVPGTEQTTSRAIPTLNITSVGSRYDNTAGDFMSGMIAWPAIWNVELDHADFALLAAGAHPATIRPENLVTPWDWTGADLEVGNGTFPLINNGSVPVDGPAFLQTKIARPWMIGAGFVAGGGGPAANINLLRGKLRGGLLLGGKL
jgi:hypothetical protein